MKKFAAFNHSRAFIQNHRFYAASDDALCVAARDTATVQEVHLVAIHALCAALDAEVIGG